jgi:4-hydroxyacetophenone monooxygenase
VGGTWVQNTYPEARVDTMGFSFQYKFEKGYKWEEMYPSAQELRQYLDFVANKHGVVKNFRFNREVIAGVWNESSATWKLSLNLTGELST